MDKYAKVIAFSLPREDGNVDAIAIDEEGKFLSAQVCSGESWVKGDLCSDFHVWFYEEHIGEDFVIEFVDTPPKNWDGQREHTDETVKPWHLDPENNSTLFQDEV